MVIPALEHTILDTVQCFFFLPSCLYLFCSLEGTVSNREATHLVRSALLQKGHFGFRVAHR